MFDQTGKNILFFLKRLLSFRGRLARVPYLLIHFGMAPLIYLFFSLLERSDLQQLSALAATTLLTLGTLIIWVGCSILVRRLHDMNAGILWTLPCIAFPFIFQGHAYVVVFILAVVPGTKGENRYGAPMRSWPQWRRDYRLHRLEKQLVAEKITLEEFNARRQDIVEKARD